MKFKHLLLSVLFGAALVAFPVARVAASTEAPLAIDVFERKDCRHCQDEKQFLEDLTVGRNDLILIFHDVELPEEKKLFDQLTTLAKISKVTPLTYINGSLIQGFSTAETTGKQLLKIMDETKGKPAVSLSTFIEKGGDQTVIKGGSTCTPDGDCLVSTSEYWVNVPLVGPVNVAQYSLPVLSLVLGLVDGFNPCAMWVLVLFLTILLEAGSRRRMLEMAGLFILAEGIMYFLILNVWMTTWDFVGLDNVVTPLVGFVAVGAGTYFLYNFYKADTTCKVGSLETKRKTTQRIKHYASVPMTIPVALGILGLAFSVNIIEFACSVGIPQTFTKILEMSYLSTLSRQFYNMLYILMYMVDDLIVFGMALYSFDKIGLTTAKYTRASHLIGGSIMILLGLILLLKPSLLVFG